MPSACALKELDPAYLYYLESKLMALGLLLVSSSFPAAESPRDASSFGSKSAIPTYLLTVSTALSSATAPHPSSSRYSGASSSCEGSAFW